MNKKKLAFISFEPDGNRFKAYLDLDFLFTLEDNPEVLLKKAENIYKQEIDHLNLQIKEVNNFKKNNIPIPAKLIWKIGNSIFKLKNNLEANKLQIDDLYEHLTRDLGVGRMWLHRVISFRRHLNDDTLIPDDLLWNHCKKGSIRLAADKIKKGSLLFL